MMKYLKFLFSPALMGILFVVFAIAMAAATFYENDFGSAAAYNMVYNSLWFELILLLLSVNLIGQVITQNLLSRAKLSIGLFHLSFIVMILGAAVTRYTGWEGTMHIREGESQQLCYSNDKFLGFTVLDQAGKQITERNDKYSLTNVSADEYKKSFSIEGRNYDIVLSRIIPNASQSVAEVPNGEPLISLMFMENMMSSESLVFRNGERKTASGITVGFNSKEPADLNISADSGKFTLTTSLNISISDMMTKDSVAVSPGKPVALAKMQVLSVGKLKIIPRDLTNSGVINISSSAPGEQPSGMNAFIFHVISGKKTDTVNLWDRDGERTASASCDLDGHKLNITYGSKPTTLPFSIKLNDFILDRYPGSSSPSGYKSDVVLLDKAAGVEKPYMIFMNNILKYKGYRFYQSSFDRDELGTVLSVNHDRAGMMITYSGYILLFIFIIISLANRRSAFHTVTSGFWNSSIRKTAVILLMLLALSPVLNAQKLITSKEAADEFGKVLVQDQKGRTKPLFTMSNDILRKVARANTFEGLSSMQVFMGLYLDFKDWKDVRLISIGNNDLRTRLGIPGKYASFADLVKVDGSGTYVIAEDVNAAYAKSPAERNKLDKEVMKIDERVNIIYMIFKGDFIKLFPLKDNSHNWGSPQEALKLAVNREDSVYLEGIIPALSQALETNNISNVKQVTESITAYQNKFSQYSLPSTSRTKAELLYYKLGIFEKLFPFYATVGIIMLIALITMVIQGRKEKSLLVKILGWVLFAGFLFHTIGLALRWYIAGHSPMSNGYESMIFISWATLLAGFIFSRKSAFALSATAVLASMTLMVAHLSFMDPEITNLVPVLKSYWLTLHVSVITGSYGFLGLGAILGLIVMILISLSNDKNRGRISATVDELTVINFKTLTLGLYFLTIGTFLGAVWANESWGRYWGWDPKETWSLITIIIYSIVVHSRRIPGMKDIFTFNLTALFAFSSVLMTYFGVNYYLSGMHSYAAGDPVPVPSFVYIAVIALAAISFIAYTRYNAGIKQRDKQNK